MSDWLDYQIGLIVTIQNLGNWLLGAMLGISLLGSHEFYLLVIPGIYWCLDMGVGLRLGLALLVSGSVNGLLKTLIHSPRPFWVTPEIEAYGFETSFGMPSGHAQSSLVMFGMFGRFLKTRWIWISFVILLFLIGFSRLYLGVHFLSDVLGGWWFGGLLLLIFVRLESPVSAWFSKQAPTPKYLLAFLFSFSMIGTGWLIHSGFSNWVFPVEWMTNILKNMPPGESFSPFSLEDFVTYSGTVLGWLGGAIWIQSCGGFKVQGKSIHLLGRYILGVAVLLLLYFGLGSIFPRGDSLTAFLFRYLRYALIGLWISALAPILFKRLHLAEKKETPNPL